MSSRDGIDVALHGKVGNFCVDTAFHTTGQGVTVLYGPSGCGKTTVLRAIAGLNRLSGRVWIADKCWQDDPFFLPVHCRPIGYVFQEANLFAHLNVRANLTYGVDKKITSPALSFSEVADMLDIGHLVDRMPHNLSGGERQRVAIGRALLANPHVLLMDEPLSALDRKARDEIMPFLERLRDTLKLPIIYITHSIDEVERLADTLVLMQEGRVIGAGPLEKLQADPALPLAQTRGAAVNLQAQVSHQDNGLLCLHVGEEKFYVPSDEIKPARHMRIRIAAGDVSLAIEKPGNSSILNTLPGRILSSTAVGQHEMLVLVALGRNSKGVHILSRISSYSWARLGLAEGMPVYAQVKGVALISR